MGGNSIRWTGYQLLVGLFADDAGRDLRARSEHGASS